MILPGFSTCPLAMKYGFSNSFITTETTGWSPGFSVGLF